MASDLPSLGALGPVLPEIVLAIAALVVLLVGVFSLKRERSGLLSGVAIAILLVVAIYVGLVGTGDALLFNGSFVNDGFARFMKVLVLGGSAFALLLSLSNAKENGLAKFEYAVLVMLATVGMMIMISANHLLTLYLGLELLSLSLYSLVALQRDSAIATEAAMKYFVLGALASGLLLYGLSMIYGATGSLELTRVAHAIESGDSLGLLGVFGLVFVVAGIAFKLGAAPFHMWIPDVYHGAATPTTLYIGAAPKLAAFAFIIRLLANGLQGMTADWQQMLVVLAVASLLVGNVIAIAQSNLKRMLAYSTIAHMGFMLLGVIAGDDTGYGAAMFYAIAYALMTLGSFGAILLLSRAGFEAENIDDFRGLNQKSKWFAFMMLIVMFSLAGIPPTVGFFAKLAVLQAVLDAGYTWLVVLAVLLSVVGAFYYLRIVRLMYMEAPDGEVTVDPRPGTQWVLSAAGLAMLVLGILPAPLWNLCMRAIAASM